METIRTQQLDDIGASVFFPRQVEYIKSEMYNILYPEYKAFSLFPIDTSAGPAAEVIVWHEFDTVGYMKIIASYAKDLPRSDVLGSENFQIVKSLGGSYGWNLQEVRTAVFANRPLGQMKAQAARRSYDQTVNKLAWYGDATNKIIGFLNQPNVPAGPVQVGATTGNTTWLGASPKNNEEILKDMNDIFTDTFVFTKGVENMNTLLLPTEEYAHIQTTRNSDSSDVTILEYFLRNRPGVTVDWVNELADVANPPSGAAGPLNVMAAYTRSMDKMSLQLPQLFEQLPVQEHGLEYEVPTHARIGGIIFYYPLSARFVEGI